MIYQRYLLYTNTTDDTNTMELRPTLRVISGNMKSPSTLKENLISFIDHSRSRSGCEWLQTQGLTACGSLNIFGIGASGKFRLPSTAREVTGAQARMI